MLQRYEYEDVDMLVNIVSSIYKDVERLCDLELSNQRDSQEYSAIFQEVSRIISVYDSVLKRLTTSGEKCNEIVSYLKTKSEFKNSAFANVEIPILLLGGQDLNAQDMVFGHIINCLSKSFLDNPSFSYLDSAKEFNIPEEVISHAKETAMHQMKLQMYLTSDVHNLFIALNEQMLTSMSSGELKREIIRSKYTIGFLMPNEMSGLFENGFSPNLHPYLISDTIIKVYPKESELSLQTMEVCLSNNMLNTIKSLASEDSISLMDPKNMANALLRQNMIRAFLVVAEGETLNKMTTFITKTIAILQGQDPRSIPAQMLADVLRSLPEDKTIPQIVSFAR